MRGGKVEDEFRPQYPNAIAQFMCDVAEDVLWATIQPWVSIKAPNLHFHTRVGSGKRTYCLFERRSRKASLTFGIGLVADHQNPLKVHAWLSTKEILSRNYFGGDVTFMNLMAHVVCHEMAHVVQNIRGERYANSVHNPEFYRILDKMHTNGHAHRVRDRLKALLLQAGIPTDYWSQNELASACPQPSAEFKAGNMVAFELKGQVITAKVSRVNQKTLSVYFNDSTGKRRARVPLHMCTLQRNVSQ